MRASSVTISVVQVAEGEKMFDLRKVKVYEPSLPDTP